MCKNCRYFKCVVCCLNGITVDEEEEHDCYEE